MTRRDKWREGTVNYELQRRGRDRLYWLVSAAGFLGGVLLQLL